MAHLMPKVAVGVCNAVYSVSSHFVVPPRGSRLKGPLRAGPETDLLGHLAAERPVEDGYPAGPAPVAAPTDRAAAA